MVPRRKQTLPGRVVMLLHVKLDRPAKPQVVVVIVPDQYFVVAMAIAVQVVALVEGAQVEELLPGLPGLFLQKSRGEGGMWGELHVTSLFRHKPTIVGSYLSAFYKLAEVMFF